MPGILDDLVRLHQMGVVEPTRQPLQINPVAASPGLGGILGGGRNNIALEKSYEIGPQLQIYKIKRGDDTIGEVHAGTMGPGNLTIHNVFATDSKGNPLPPEQSANTLGTGTMMGVLSNLRQLYPDATNITGNRISGAMQGGTYSEGARAPKIINFPPSQSE